MKFGWQEFAFYFLVGIICGASELGILGTAVVAIAAIALFEGSRSDLR